MVRRLIEGRSRMCLLDSTESSFEGARSGALVLPHQPAELAHGVELGLATGIAALTVTVNVTGVAGAYMAWSL